MEENDTDSGLNEFEQLALDCVENVHPKVIISMLLDKHPFHSLLYYLETEHIIRKWMGDRDKLHIEIVPAERSTESTISVE